MKIIKALSLVSALLLALTLSACGAADTDSNKTAGASESSSLSASSSDSELSTQTNSDSASSASQASSVQSQTAAVDYTATVKKLITVLSDVDKIGAGCLAISEVQTIKKGDLEYAKVTDKRFTSTADISKYMKDALTDNMISTRYSSILGTEAPCVIDENGSLYATTAAKGGGFTWTDDAPEISDKTDSSFTAKVKYDNFGAASTMTIKVVSDNGIWKIDSITI